MLLKHGGNTSAFELRDLRRYYALFECHLIELSLTPDEASLICEALQNYRLEDEPDRGRVIWKHIDRAIQLQHLDRHSIFDTINI
jgi:hypothetical protein